MPPESLIYFLEKYQIIAIIFAYFFQVTLYYNNMLELC